MSTITDSIEYHNIEIDCSGPGQEIGDTQFNRRLQELSELGWKLKSIAVDPDSEIYHCMFERTSGSKIPYEFLKETSYRLGDKTPFLSGQVKANSVNSWEYTAMVIQKQPRGGRKLFHCFYVRPK